MKKAAPSGAAFFLSQDAYLNVVESVNGIDVLQTVVHDIQIVQYAIR